MPESLFFPMPLRAYIEWMDKQGYTPDETTSVYTYVTGLVKSGDNKVTYTMHNKIQQALTRMFLSGYVGGYTYKDTDSMHVETTPIFDTLFMNAARHPNFHDGCTIDFQTGTCVNHDSGYVIKLNPATRYGEWMRDYWYRASAYMKTPSKFVNLDDIV